MEYHSGAIFHASDTLLERFDSAQRRFLQEIDVSPEAVFIEHNFAPPRLRRNIGMLGFLHKRVLGLSHQLSSDFSLFMQMCSVLCDRGNITNNCTIIFWTCNNNILCIVVPCLAWFIFTIAYHNTWLISRPFHCSKSILPLKRVSYAKMGTHHGLIPSLVACKSCTYAFFYAV